MGTSCAVFRFLLVVTCGAALSSCGPAGVVDLRAIDVTLVETERCTLTGQASRNCTDPAELATTSTSARWIVSVSRDQTSNWNGSSNATITLTTDDGRTLPGLMFDNNATTLNTTGCTGEGGDCVFARRRFSTSDINTGCETFNELFVVGHFDVDDERQFSGQYTAVAGANEACGTATVNDSIFSVVGVVVDEPVLAVEEAQ